MKTPYTKIERTEIYKKCIAEKGKAHPNLMGDFLALISIDGYYETEKYYFYLTRMYGVKEMRYWKGSNRVSVSSKLTKPLDSILR